MRTSTTQPPLGTKLNMSHPLSQGLAASWLMNEGGGTKIFDGTGLNTIPAPLTNGPVFKATQKGTGISFDGSNDYIDGGSASVLNPGTGNFSISVWIWAANSNQAGVICQKRSAATFPFYGLSIDDNCTTLTVGKRIGVIFNQNSSNQRSYDTTSSVIDGNWHHLLATWTLSGNVVVLYVDGVSAPLTARTVQGTETSIVPDASLKIGSNTGAAFFFNGLMNNFKIWNRALSATEAMQLYANPYSMYVGK